ncbi:Wnt-4-like [Paramuricea clavata]|uniref:Protein Wnt n=1 Tax=Paramuricea clavata TaxID=317549 RepID=A0A7D9HPC1_PARCT|nr:Wnt-4-like [Paramuricea clavata]
MRMYLLTIKIQSVLVAIVLILQEVHSFRWLGINSTLVDESDDADLRRYLCSSSPTASKNRLLNKEQKKICRQNVKMMKYVVTAVELARTECLRLSEFERWDCTGILQAPKFPKDLRVGTREAAFLRALSSAALVFAVTQRCATDGVCDCGKQPRRSLLKRHKRKNPGWKYAYGGCHDNIAVGTKFSIDFLDGHEIRQTKHNDRKLTKLHNNDLGRKIVERSLNITCRCPNFEQCATKECTRMLIVPFSKIAEDLFGRYQQAKLVTGEKSKSAKFGMVLKIKNDVRSYKKLRKVEARSMVYLSRSRDFCLADVHNPYKYPGTKGRECAMRLRSNIRNLAEYNPTLSLNFNVCANLCCGRGSLTKKVEKQVTCTCRFSKTKMDVVCKECPVDAVYHICN